MASSSSLIGSSFLLLIRSISITKSSLFLCFYAETCQSFSCSERLNFVVSMLVSVGWKAISCICEIQIMFIGGKGPFDFCPRAFECSLHNPLYDQKK